VKLSICPPSATVSGSSAGAGGFDMWDCFLDRTGIEDGEGVYGQLYCPIEIIST
jgi:hypothetical protein